MKEVGFSAELFLQQISLKTSMILSSIMAYFYQQFSGQVFACSMSEKYFILP